MNIPRVYTYQEILDMPDPDAAGTWGNWRYEESTNEIVFKDEMIYAVDLDTCKTSAGVLDWIFQVHKKRFITDADMRDLLRALRAIVHPQQTLCSVGVEQSAKTP